MRRRPGLFATALTAAAALAAASSAARAQHIVGTRDARALRADSVFQRFDRTDSPGCALGVYQDGKVLYARGYGMASLEFGVALSPRSVLDVGSISKQFTAIESTGLAVAALFVPGIASGKAFLEADEVCHPDREEN
jgi:CubicO group peptidase (beta-lactamase class C family)